MLTLGAAGDFLVPADYDGDGKIDPAVYRSSEGKWYAALSFHNYAIFSIDLIPNSLNTIPAPADYDGDGKADPSVYDVDNLVWLLRLSGSNYSLHTVDFGLPEAFPVFYKK